MVVPVKGAALPENGHLDSVDMIVFGWVWVVLLTIGAESPIHDLCFVDAEAVMFGRFEAWGRADGTVDVDGNLALSADEVVVVVTNSGLVKRRSTGGFDAPKNSG